MKDMIMSNGEKSCLCSKCHSKNVYYLLQKKVLLPVSPKGKLIENEENGKWHTLRTIREKFLAYSTAWAAEDIEYLVLICRNCGESEEIPG